MNSESLALCVEYARLIERLAFFPEHNDKVERYATHFARLFAMMSRTRANHEGHKAVYGRCCTAIRELKALVNEK